MSKSIQEVYVSGYTNDKGVGIYHYDFDTSTGILTCKGLAAESVNASYFCFRKSDQQLYTCNEVGKYKGKETGYISAYSRNEETGKLTLNNEQPSGGEDPCHAICDSTGKHLLVANYSGGSASVFPIETPGISESKLGAYTSNLLHNERYKATEGIPDRQEKPHVHSINLDPTAQQYAFANDLGCDLLVTYKFDHKNDGELTYHSTFQFPVGTGPRHLKFAPNNNNFCYVLTELSNDVYMLEFNFNEGEFYKVQEIHALPQDFKGKSLGSEIDITPNGKFLYASMRDISEGGHDVITIFRIDEYSGKLVLVGHQPSGGKHPRHFTIDRTGEFLLVGNKDSNNIVVFKIDKEIGTLEQVSSVEHVQPTCIKIWE